MQTDSSTEATNELEREAERDAIERQRVELVFGLTGGELNDDTWSPYCISFSGNVGQFVVRYNYDGVPEWAEREFENSDDHWATTTYKTMVRDIMFGDPPEVVYDEHGIWERVVTYPNGGEADCYCKDMIAPHLAEGPNKDCQMCEGDGFVYIGDGWAEIVYKLISNCAECETLGNDDEDN